jgi:DNA-binding LacI/PurR family transcriptional regulator
MASRTARAPAGAARRRPPTMKDVAALAGVAPSTVSRILSDAELAVPVSAATRERVRASARELGFRPNPLARGLRGASTMLIGAVIRDITDPFFATAIDALCLQARHHGYSVVLGHARGEADVALALAGVLEARQCDAIVLIGDISDQPRLVEDLRSVELPVVELWQGSMQRDFPVVGVDNAAGMRATLGHLAALGHERIAFVGDDAKADVRERRDAYLAFQARRGTPVAGQYMAAVANRPAGGAAAADALLALPDPPTAIVAATDVLAFGVLHRAFARGLEVPGELSVTGFDDIPLAATAVPPLTTVRMPVTEMVTAAVEIAIDEAARPAEAMRPAALRVFAPELVVRCSSGPVRAPR